MTETNIAAHAILPAETAAPATPAVPTRYPLRPLLHLGLFLLTGTVIVLWWMPDWWSGLLYAVGLLGILSAHEFGHYFAARHYGVDVTLPYFIPGIPPLFTFGAFIKMRAEQMSPQALLVIGASGPIAGALVAIPLYIVGIALSETTPLPALVAPNELLFFGESLLSWSILKLMVGEIPAGHDVVLHPLAYAGWVGFFVTALNLIPIGQLDGGHVGYALFGRAYHKVARVLFWLLVLCGTLIHPAWLVLSIFLITTGVEHPPITRGQGNTLPRWAKVIGGVAFALFALTFVPSPVHLPSLPELFVTVFNL